MSKRDRVEDLLSPHSTINPAEEIPEDDDIFADDDLEEGGIKEYDLFNLSDESEEPRELNSVFSSEDHDEEYDSEDEYGYMDDDPDEEDDSEESYFCGVTYPDEDFHEDDNFHEDEDADDVISTLCGLGSVINKPKVNQYVTVEFEVKDEFKPAFKTILSIMRMFKDDSI